MPLDLGQLFAGLIQFGGLCGQTEVLLHVLRGSGVILFSQQEHS